MWHTRGYCWRRGDFPERFLAKRWSLLVDLMSRVLMAVVSTAVDGGRGRIVGLKLRWPTQIAALFRPDEAEKTMKTTSLFLYRRVETFLWWRGGWRWPDMGDRRRERESPARGERCSGLCYGEHTSTVHRCSWCPWSVGSLWNDRVAVIGPICRLIGRSGWTEVWSRVTRCTGTRYTGWRGATGSKLRLLQGLRCVWVLI